MLDLKYMIIIVIMITDEDENDVNSNSSNCNRIETKGHIRYFQYCLMK